MQDALNRLIMGTSAGDGVDGASALEIEHRDDLKGTDSSWRWYAFVVLVHEWVTGGGLAGIAAARLVGARRQCDAPGDRRVILPRLSIEEIKVVMTLDARLPAEPGPWRVEPIAPGEHGRKLRELCRRADFTVLIAPETRGVAGAA